MSEESGWSAGKPSAFCHSGNQKRVLIVVVLAITASAVLLWRTSGGLEVTGVKHEETVKRPSVKRASADYANSDDGDERNSPRREASTTKDSTFTGVKHEETVKRPSFKRASADYTNSDDGDERNASTTKNSTFVFLLQARGLPSEKWINRSHWTNCSVIWLIWKELGSSPAKLLVTDTFVTVSMPGSTWTSGRNRLLSETYKLEARQNWRFEFLLFFDEDGFLSYRSEQNPGNVVQDENDDVALRKLQGLVKRDRPMRAGIGFNPSEDLGEGFSQKNYGCIRKCHMDPIVSIYHRTAVNILLPYTEKYDKVSWYASGVISDIFASAVIPSFCHVYEEVLVELSKQLHHPYPKKMDTGLLFDFVNTCLSKALYRDYKLPTNVGEFKKGLEGGMGFHGGLGISDHFRQVGEYTCRHNAVGVNFSETLGTQASGLWREHCLSL